ncbi:uncharacterized protein C5orf49-like [Ischnura elegans]|uniref:uncharacterized protein C5orf49-like n=1 Tax=Ischnura elegans TaxID=197161 RepID=UPI001ED8B24E|nr:uncharacterized protein C5orf49-like [Ischnura elegans]
MSSSPVQIDKFYSDQWAKLEKPCFELPTSFKTLSYYNNNKTYSEICQYDVLFHPKEGYDQSMHRCDRLNWRKIDEGIFNEERGKPVSVLSSFDYGKSTQPLEFPGMFQRKLNTRGDFVTKGRWDPQENDAQCVC